MTYGRFLKPRIFSDSINWNASRGWAKSSSCALNNNGWATGSSIYDVLDLNPINTGTLDTNGEDGTTARPYITFDQAVSSRPNTFVAILNHNLNAAGAKIRVASSSTEIDEYDGEGGGGNDGVTVSGVSSIINGAVSSNIVTPSADGDTLFTFTESGNRYWSIEFQGVGANFTADIEIGAIMIGEYYTMPHSPDQSIEHGFMTDGISIQETVGGKRYANANWVRGNDETYQANYMPFRRATGLRQMPGREYYSCSFSFLADTDMLPSNMKTTGDTNDFAYDVFNKLNWQQFPCIFTPDSTSTTEGDYIFGRLAGNSFSLTQQAHNLYSTGFRIEQEF